MYVQGGCIGYRLSCVGFLHILCPKMPSIHNANRHPAVHAAYMRAWRKAHPDLAKAISDRAEAKRRGRRRSAVVRSKPVNSVKFVYVVNSCPPPPAPTNPAPIRLPKPYTYIDEAGNEYEVPLFLRHNSASAPPPSADPSSVSSSSSSDLPFDLEPLDVLCYAAECSAASSDPYFFEPSLTNLW
jgi:hypothetical protein